MTMLTLCASHVKQKIDSAFESPEVQKLLREQKRALRVRKLPPATSVFLLLLQLLHGTPLLGLRHLTDINATASAICQARARLPLQLFYQLIKQVTVATLDTLVSDSGQLFLGLQVVLLDATSFHTQDTPQLAGHYGKSKNQHPAVPGYPSPKLLCLVHYATGLIIKAIDLPASRQEHMLLRRIVSHLVAGQIVVADRGLVSFPFLWELLHISAHACLRLPKGQLAKVSKTRRILQRLGEGDLLVEWHKDSHPTKAYSKKTYRLLPGVITLRQVTFTFSNPGCKPKTITLITTLLDPLKYPAAEIAGLYRRRWQIELYFRDLKQTQGMKQIKARSLMAARKELLGHILLYNLIRAVMLEAAGRQGVEAHRLSFSDARRQLCWAARAGPPTDLIVNPTRDRPSQPRKVKTRRGKYPPMKMTRAAYQELALKKLEKHAA